MLKQCELSFAILLSVGVTWYLAWDMGIPATIIATAVPHSVLPSPVPLREQRKSYRGPLGYPGKQKKTKTVFFMHGYQVPASPSLRTLPDLGHVNWI